MNNLNQQLNKISKETSFIAVLDQSRSSAPEILAI